MRGSSRRHDRGHHRGAALSLALLLAATLVSGCSEESEDGPDPTPSVAVEPDAPVAGDVPFALVLPDAVSLSRDGSQVLANCWDGICRWDTGDGSLAQVDDGGQLAASPDWSLFASIGEGAEVVLRDAESGAVVHELAGHRDAEVTDGGPVLDVAFSPDGERLASVGRDGDVLVWSAEDGSRLSSIDTGEDVSALAFSPDGSQLATAGGAPAQVFDATSGDPVATLAGASSDSAGLAWSPDGRWLAAAGIDAAPTVWRAGDFARVRALEGRRLQQLAWSPDSTTLALTDTEDDRVRLWTPGRQDAAAEVRELTGHAESPEAVVFAPDGSALYSVARTEGVLAWDLATATLARRFELPER